MKHHLIFLILLITLPSYGQGHEDIFPDKSGSELMNLLRANYKPSKVLSYHDAREEMYTKIDNVNDSVFCIYSDYGLAVDSSDSDAIGTLIRDGSRWGINCEHTFPQSKGASNGNARSDMHHLFPARAEINEARSNFPFGEIEDHRTKKWYFLSEVLSNIPSSNIDEYSESIDGLFEPKERHKGNAARAIFYFYTMYRSQSDGAFFGQQREALCDWHYQDPVDENEWKRNNQIAIHQGGKKNPFILDCTLAQRSYCPDKNEICFTSTQDQDNINFINVYPNPSINNIFIDLKNREIKRADVIIRNSIGSEIYHQSYYLSEGKNLVNFDLPNPGIYILEIHWNEIANSSMKYITKLIQL